MPRLLVDTAVLSGHANSLPLTWLDGFELLPFAPRELTPHTPHAGDADALLVRTTTRVAAPLLAGLPRLRAVATLSSGTDHLDLRAIRERGVSLHTGHGGNAIAVADWVHWALSRLTLQNRRVLIVGVGAVGTAVARLLTACGFELTFCDPPRAEREPDFAGVTLDEALRQGPWGAVTLHVPKALEGAHATQDLLNRPRLQQLRGAVVLNAARGGVLEEVAALTLRAEGFLGGLAVDTFCNEPRPRADLLHAADLATPHLAGHSIEGKLRVAHRAMAGLRTALDLPPSGTLATAIRDVLATLGERDLAAFPALDAANLALKGQPERFEEIRHDHRRIEHFLP